MTKYILIFVFVLLIPMGCADGLKKTEKSSIVSGVGTNLWKVIPGYRSRRLKNLDFYIEVESKELKRQQIGFDSRVLRKKLLELDKVKEVETK